MLDLFAASKISLGTVKFGRNQGVKYPKSFEIPQLAQLADLLDLAQDLGINLIDTAPAYGDSEAKLGKLLAGKRDKWLLSTKVGEQFSGGISKFDFSESAVVSSVHQSLQRLNTDYLDCVLVHSDGNDLEIINQYGVLDVLANLKQEGLIRYVGMSTKTYAGTTKVLEQADGVMIEYNLAQDAATAAQQRELIDLAKQTNKFVFIKKAFNSGKLTTSGNIEDVFKLIYGEAGVTSTIVGSINPEHLKQNVAVCQAVIDNC